MTAAFLLVSCIAFAELLVALDLKGEAQRILTRSKIAYAALRSRELGDDAKEAAMRRESLQVARATAQLIAKFAVILIVLAGLFWITTLFAPGIEASITEKLASPLVMVALTVTAIGYVWGRNAVLD